MKRPSAWDRAVKPCPTKFTRWYGMQVRQVEIATMEFTEAWIDNMRVNVLFDNFTSSMTFEPQNNRYIVKFVCPDVYESECNIVIP